MKLFEEYLEEGIAKTQTPDFSRAKALRREAEESYSILKEFLIRGITDRNANYVVKNVYDIIMQLIRAKMLAEGFGTSGQGAHGAEVAYLNKLGFKIHEVEFVDQLRYFRNGILYYGKTFDNEYAKKVVEILEGAYSRLEE